MPLAPQPNNPQAAAQAALGPTQSSTAGLDQMYQTLLSHKLQQQRTAQSQAHQAQQNEQSRIDQSAGNLLNRLVSLSQQNPTQAQAFYSTLQADPRTRQLFESSSIGMAGLEAFNPEIIQLSMEQRMDHAAEGLMVELGAQTAPGVVDLRNQVLSNEATGRAEAEYDALRVGQEAHNVMTRMQESGIQGHERAQEQLAFYNDPGVREMEQDIVNTRLATEAIQIEMRQSAQTQAQARQAHIDYTSRIDAFRDGLMRVGQIETAAELNEQYIDATGEDWVDALAVLVQGAFSNESVYGASGVSPQSLIESYLDAGYHLGQETVAGREAERDTYYQIAEFVNQRNVHTPRPNEEPNAEWVRLNDLVEQGLRRLQQGLYTPDNRPGPYFYLGTLLAAETDTNVLTTPLNEIVRRRDQDAQ